MLPANYANTSNYKIAKDLATNKAQRHGKSTWPFVENQKEILGVTAKKGSDGRIRTSIMETTPEPGLFAKMMGDRKKG